MSLLSAFGKTARICKTAAHGFAAPENQNGASPVPEAVIVDTDILIDTGRDVEDAVKSLETLGQTNRLALSVVTQMELIIGCRNKGELLLLNDFLKRFLVIKIDWEVSDLAVDLLKQYRLSHGLLIADALIAATVMVHDARLASKNQRDYRFIEGLDLLDYPIEKK
jgi:predicted nucleic acid-binding protein